ncbi:hypothetical protein ASPTUDRAFT_340708 [Aspergillus tubingensis CBS 134.48]|uniref:Uncharacterized protein n=1 Tax=Aspergillus tubingensis (strain CBS 134.48) TaxID=767770 RepID=A0A1L9NKC2_ASPTC|nr:hypothetical protein ASPTUDRAFT_340708 [Aspergillus tubingensis CBS 134.48]
MTSFWGSVKKRISFTWRSCEPNMMVVSAEILPASSSCFPVLGCRTRSSRLFRVWSPRNSTLHTHGTDFVEPSRDRSRPRDLLTIRAIPTDVALCEASNWLLFRDWPGTLQYHSFFRLLVRSMPPSFCLCHCREFEALAGFVDGMGLEGGRNGVGS